MKDPKVIFILKDLTEITDFDPALKTRKDIERAVKKAVGDAEKIAKNALDHLTIVLNQSSTAAMQGAWNADANVKAFFGKAPGRSRMQQTCDRLARAYRRLRDRRLRIRLKSQEGKKWSGHNAGGPLSPRQFVLFPKWFAGNAESRGAVIVHELLHDWHVDHKVKDPATGKRETAYGEGLAKELARRRPAAARRNPENFEQFCRALWH